MRTVTILSNTQATTQSNTINRSVLLFDWGNTLMIDFPTAHGKMCDWPKVEAVNGAFETLFQLSQHADIYIATSAQDSSENDIEKAFARVQLSQFIKGYFCFANVGVLKGDPAFLPNILSVINANNATTTMIGDSLINDIKPALAAGIKAVWVKGLQQGEAPANAKVINDLRELCDLIAQDTKNNKTV